MSTVHIKPYHFPGDFSQLLTRREEDMSSAGFKNWTFTTAHFWGTNPNGDFKLSLAYTVKTKKNNT